MVSFTVIYHELLTCFVPLSPKPGYMFTHRCLPLSDDKLQFSISVSVLGAYLPGLYFLFRSNCPCLLVFTSQTSFNTLYFTHTLPWPALCHLPLTSLLCIAYILCGNYFTPFVFSHSDKNSYKLCWGLCKLCYFPLVRHSFSMNVSLLMSSKRHTEKWRSRDCSLRPHQWKTFVLRFHYSVCGAELWITWWWNVAQSLAPPSVVAQFYFSEFSLMFRSD